MNHPNSESKRYKQPVVLNVDFQLVLKNQRLQNTPPDAASVKSWAQLAYSAASQELILPNNNDVTIRLVEKAEITDLNQRYRSKDKPTNVLSFPAEVPEGIDVALLGDVVICHDIVVEEANSENKTLQQHYAHMVTHGVLHLCGYDHDCDTTADEMETLEAKILKLSGFPNPYN